MEETENKTPSNFIHDFIDKDLEDGVYKPVFRPNRTDICT